MSVSSTTSSVAQDATAGRSNRLVSSAWWDVIAPTSILVAPTLAFVSYHDYSFLKPEILAGIGLLVFLGTSIGLLIPGRGWLKVAVLACLLTFYIDIQFASVFLTAGPFWSKAALPLAGIAALCLSLRLREHLSLLVSTVFGTIIVSTLAMPPGGSSVNVTENEQLKTDSTLPPIIHIVLDEHIGIEGIPVDLDVGMDIKRDLKRFFADRGFYVFGKAFSRFYRSEWSLGHVLNPGLTFDQSAIETSHDRFAWRVRDNAYFESLEDTGYNINVYQFEHIDYCSSAKRRLARCLTYNVSSLGWLQNTSLTISERLRVISGTYVYYSSIYRNLRRAYNSAMKRFIKPRPPLSQWYWERVEIGTIAGLANLERLRRDLDDGATGGQYYFAHIDMPHYPYLYDRNCRLLRPEQWATRNLPRSLRQYADPTGFRTHNYGRYFEQMRCMYTQLGKLLDVVERSATLRNAVVILHGDHGSRMTLREPSVDNWEELTQSEIVDNFSTLFAFRAPAIEPGYDLRQVPIQRLLGPLYEKRFESVPGTKDAGPGDHVMVRDRNGWAERPISDFGERTEVND